MEKIIDTDEDDRKVIAELISADSDAGIIGWEDFTKLVVRPYKYFCKPHFKTVNASLILQTFTNDWYEGDIYQLWGTPDGKPEIYLPFGFASCSGCDMLLEIGDNPDLAWAEKQDAYLELLPVIRASVVLGGDNIRTHLLTRDAGNEHNFDSDEFRAFKTAALALLTPNAVTVDASGKESIIRVAEAHVNYNKNNL